MSVDVKYKGATIATVETQETKTLTTAGKYCEGDIVLTDDSNPIAEDNDVIFIDYDGTIRYSYSADEFLALTELPPNPHHAGLTAQGWNWTLADAKNYVQQYKMLTIGQMYVTDSGDTEIDIYLDDGRLSPVLGLNLNGTATVDWGDGATDQITGSSLNVLIYKQHNYSSPGLRTIKIKPNTATVRFYGITGAAGILTKSNYNSYFECAVYGGSARAIRIGTNISDLGQSAFRRMAGLQTVTVPSTITSLGPYIFDSTPTIKEFTVPSGCKVNMSQFANGYGGKYFSFSKAATTEISGGAFQGSLGISRIEVPDGVTTIGQLAFYSCFSLRRVALPGSLTSIQDRAFQNDYSISKIVIPSLVSTIGSQSFSGCRGLAEIEFKASTPPTVSNSNCWTDVATDCVIIVPYSADHSVLNAYKTETNYPDPSVYTYMEASA